MSAKNLQYVFQELKTAEGVMPMYVIVHAPAVLVAQGLLQAFLIGKSEGDWAWSATDDFTCIMQASDLEMTGACSSGPAWHEIGPMRMRDLRDALWYIFMRWTVEYVENAPLEIKHGNLLDEDADAWFFGYSDQGMVLEYDKDAETLDHISYHRFVG